MRYNLMEQCSSNISTAIRSILPYPYLPEDSCLSALLTEREVEQNRSAVIEKNKKNPNYDSEKLEMDIQIFNLDIREGYEKIIQRYSHIAITPLENRMLKGVYYKNDTFESAVYAMLAEKHEKKSIFYLPRPMENYDNRMASLESLLGNREDAKIDGNTSLRTTGSGFMKNLSRTAYCVLPLAALTSAALVGIAGTPTLWNLIWTSVAAGSIEKTYIDNLPDIEKQEKALVERARKMDSILSDLSDKYGDALLPVL
jgi:hypothetical protein